VARCLYLRSDDRTPPNPTPNRAIEIYGFVSPDTQSVRHQNIWRRSRRRLAEWGPRLGIDVRRRACGAASADVRWSVA
jgi:hypothetical protein